MSSVCKTEVSEPEQRDSRKGGRKVMVMVRLDEGRIGKWLWQRE